MKEERESAYRGRAAGRSRRTCEKKANESKRRRANFVEMLKLEHTWRRRQVPKSGRKRRSMSRRRRRLAVDVRMNLSNGKGQHERTTAQGCVDRTHQSEPARCFARSGSATCLLLGGAFLEVSCPPKALGRPRKQRRLFLGDGAQQQAVVVLDLAVRVCVSSTWRVSKEWKGVEVRKAGGLTIGSSGHASSLCCSLAPSRRRRATIPRSRVQLIVRRVGSG